MDENVGLLTVWEINDTVCEENDGTWTQRELRFEPVRREIGCELFM